MNANIPNSTRKAVYRRDGYRCALCDDTRGIQIHHIVHRSQGGSDEAMNLITLCWRCHAAVHGTRLPDRPGLDEVDYEQAMVEYISDLYAEMGIVWCPWEKLPF